MPELTKEEKLKLIEKLPQQLQEFLYSEDTGAILLYFGKKYNLPDEKIAALSKIMADIILKITPITNLAQEIVNKVISDPQIATTIAQELNSELLAPALTPTPAVPVAPTPIPAAPTPKTDRYREPMAEGPEVIDLRKTPPPPMQAPVTAAPIPARLRPEPQAMAGGPPTPKPLTFTKPIEPPKPMPPLIEAEPHKTIPMVPEIPQKPAVLPRPQYIIRPPGLAPTDLPHDVLDLRKDKGEF